MLKGAMRLDFFRWVNYHMLTSIFIQLPDILLHQNSLSGVYSLSEILNKPIFDYKRTTDTFPAIKNDRIDQQENITNMIS